MQAVTVMLQYDFWSFVNTALIILPKYSAIVDDFNLDLSKQPESTEWTTDSRNNGISGNK